MADTLGQLVVELLFSGSKYEKGIKGAEAATKLFGKRMDSMASSIEHGVTRAIQGLTAAVTGFTVATAKVGTDFQDRMARIAAITELTDDQFQKITDHARKLGATTEFTAVQAAEGLMELAKAGVQVEDSMRMSREALMLAGTSGASLKLSTELLIATQRQFGLTAEDSTRIMDVYSHAMRNSLLDFKSLREAFKYAGSAGASFGMSIEETTAAIAAFRDLGLEGSLAGTNFRMAMQLAARGTDRAKVALAELGLKQADVNPALNSFADILEKTGAAGISAKQAIDIFGARAGANMAQLARLTAEGQIDLKAFTRDLIDSGGTTEKMYERIMNTVLYQAKIAISALQDLSLSLFDTFSGPLQKAIETLPPLFNKISEQVQGISGEINKSLGLAVERFTVRMKRSRQDFADVFESMVRMVTRLTETFIDLLPYLDDVVILLGSMFVAIKVVRYAQAIWEMVKAIRAAVIAMRAFAVAQAAATGGVSAIITAVVAAVAALATYAAQLIFINNTSSKMIAAQQRMDANQAKSDAAKEERIQNLLNLQNEEIRATLKSDKVLSDSTRSQLEGYLKLTAAEVRQKLATGEMIEFNNRLVYTKEALRDRGDEVREMLSEGADAMDRQARSTAALIQRLETLRNDYATGVAVGEDFYADIFKAASESTGFQIQNIGDLDIAIERLIQRQKEEADLASEYANRAAIAQSERTAQTVAEIEREVRARSEAAKQNAESDAERKRLAAEALAMEKALSDEVWAIGRTDAERRKRDLEQRLAEIDKLRSAELALHKLGSEQWKEVWSKSLDLERLAREKYRRLEKEAEQQHQAEMSSARIQAAQQTMATLQRMEAAGLTEVQRLQMEKMDLMMNGTFDRFADRMRAVEIIDAKISAARLKEERQRQTDQDAWAERVKQRHLADLEAFYDLAAAADNTFRNLMRGPLSALRAALPGVFQDVAGLLETTLGPAVRAVGKAFEGLGRIIISALGKAKKPLEDFKKKLDESAENGETKFQKFARVAINAMGEVGNAISGVAQGVFALGGTLVKIFEGLTGLDLDPGKLIKDVTQATLEARQEDPNASATGVAVRFVREMIDGAQQFIRALADSIPPLIYEFARRLPGLVDEVISYIPRISNAIVNALPRIVNALSQSIQPFVNTLSNALPSLVDSMVDNLPTITEALSASVPRILDAVLSELPRVIEALADGIRIIIESLPSIVDVVLAALPDIIEALLDSVGVIVEALTDALPGVLDAVTQRLPEIILSLSRGLNRLIAQLLSSGPRILASVIEWIPDLVTALLTEMVPQLIQDLIDSLPEMFTAINSNLPRLVAGLTMLVPELISAIILATPEITRAATIGIIEEIPGLVREMFTEIEANARELLRRLGIGRFAREGNNADDIALAIQAGARAVAQAQAASNRVGQGAFSGISYVPAPMRVTLHKGEAVVPANRNPAKVGGIQGPAPAGAANGSYAPGTYASGGARVNIVVAAEGEVLERVQVRADARGKATAMRRAMRKASGAEVGFDRGRHNPYGS